MNETQKYVKGLADRMGESAFCLTIFTKDFHMHTDGLLQFAVCCLLDKPLFLLVPDDVIIPKSVEKIAVSIERFKFGDMEDMKAASRRLIQAAQSKNFCA